MEFENYFDSVDIDVMSKILCHSHDGVPENISNLIIAQNEGCQVLQRGSLTKAIEIKTVVIQEGERLGNAMVNDAIGISRTGLRQ